MIRASYLFLRTSGPGDETLEELLRGTLLPLARAVPGVLRAEAGVVLGTPMGDLPLRAALDLYFADEDAMDAAFASAEGRALARAFTTDPRNPPESVVQTVVD